MGHDFGDGDFGVGVGVKGDELFEEGGFVVGAVLVYGYCVSRRPTCTLGGSRPVLVLEVDVFWLTRLVFSFYLDHIKG